MSPSAEFPVLVNSKIRVRLAHRRLDVRLRLAIKVMHHFKGTYLKPKDPEDTEATEWIRAQVKRHGTIVWEKTGRGNSARYAWVVKKPTKEAEVV